MRARSTWDNLSVPWNRRRQISGAGAVATATFYGSTSEPTGVYIKAEGESETLVHLPALYLDEMLRRDRKRDALKFLDRVEGFVEYARTNFPAVLMGQPPLSDEQLTAPVATVTTGITDAFRAASTFEPKMAVLRVMYPTFFAYWDWTASRLLAGQLDDVRALLDNLALQCSLYRQHGIRGVEAAKVAAFSEAGERLREEQTAPQEAGDEGDWLDEVAAELRQMLTEVSDDTFGGKAFQLPEAATWKVTKEHVVHAAGVADKSLVDALERLRQADDEHTRAQYETELDRVVAANGLEDAVEQVHAAVFG